MRAVVVRDYGGLDVLRTERLKDPEPGPGELLVRVEAAGVNYIDVYRRSGVYRGELPFVPGAEAAGTVARTGEGVTDFAPGDRVAWANQPGGYAELAVVPAHRGVPVPEGLPPATAAAVLLQGMTAHYLTHDTHPVRPGDTVLVHAAAGGMGLLLTQMVRLRGGRVIGTVSSEVKQRTALDAGAWQVLRHGEHDIAAAVRELTDGKGVAAVYDGVGAPTFDASLGALRPRGTLALFGQAGGPVPPVDPQRLNTAGSVFLTRPNLDHHIMTRDELSRRATDVFTWTAAGHIDVHIGGRYPLEEAARAHTALESRTSTGKLLLTTENHRNGHTS